MSDTKTVDERGLFTREDYATVLLDLENCEDEEPNERYDGDARAVIVAALRLAADGTPSGDNSALDAVQGTMEENGARFWNKEI